MIITSVLPADRRKCRVVLDEEISFVLYKSELQKLGLQEGCSMEESTYDHITEEILMPRARERALYLLQSQSRTRAQIQRKLAGDGYPREVIERIMGFLEEYRFVDDDSYAENYLSLNGGRKSRRQILYELQQKGIDQETAARALEETPLDEEASARGLLEKKLKGRTQITWDEKRKLGAFLGRKGYSFEVIRRVLDRLETEEPDSEL